MQREFFTIPLKEIIIDESFKNTTPAAVKIDRARDYLQTYKEVPKTIILNKNNVLIDGYCSYLAAVEAGLKEVPVCYGTVEVIEAYHRAGQRHLLWQVPVYMQGMITAGSECIVRTARGVKKVKVAAVLQQDFPQQQPSLKRVLKLL